MYYTLPCCCLWCFLPSRNPLLHFSHALYRHITQDHQLPLVLLLNKCDLIPAAAAAAWQQWLQEQLPGVTVIPVSAAKDQAAESARQVLSALLQQHVLRDGQDCSMQQLVGLSLGEHQGLRVVAWQTDAAAAVLTRVLSLHALHLRALALVVVGNDEPLLHLALFTCIVTWSCACCMYLALQMS